MLKVNAFFVTILLVLISAFKTEQNSIHPAIGDLAPNIQLRNGYGQMVQLSDLRGKVVLVDFWASWCKACRIENYTIRSNYNLFKDSTFDIGNGFEVYSISLDTDSSVWQKAIRNDRMTWTSHVSDFKKWDSPVVDLYNFRFLPHNVLLDSNGIIIAKNVLGTKLEEILKMHLAD
jgi:peroxiredoxin